MSLFEIIDKFNLDSVTDKNSVHCYIKGYYEAEFFKYKNKKITFLEIGIRTGGSLKLWSEYFTESKNIIGIDVDEYSLHDQFRDLDKVEYIFGDAYSEEIVNRIPKLDIFLDDGPHTLESQLNAVRMYLPKMNSSGLFLIEDVQEVSWFDHLEKEVNRINEDKKYKVEYVDLRYMKNMFGDHRYDDLIFAVKVK